MASLIKNSKSIRWAYNCNSWNPTESDWLRISSGIQEEEKIRIGKYVFKRDAKLSIAGRLLIRKYIVDSTGSDWNSFDIKRDDRGKPVYNDNLSLKFNISHQGDYAVIAGESLINRVGVDVMKIEYQGGRSVSEFFRIMNRQASDYEWNVIKSQKTEIEQLAMFYRFWSLKESYVKATGTGLSVDFKEISFKLNTLNLLKDKFIDNTELYFKGVKQNDWIFQEMLIDDQHCVAVALNISSNDYNHLPNKPDNFKFLEFDEIVKNLKPITLPDVGYCREFLSKEDAPM